MKFTIGSFVIWRVIIVIIALISISIVPLRIGFLGGGAENYLKNPLFWGWANMDGVHYLSIAEHGYFQFEQAFFPLFPIAINLISKILMGNYLFSGLLISNLASVAAIFVIYKLIQLDFPSIIAKWTILLLLIFPTSFFLGSLYNESLFILLVASSFYLMRKKKWWISAIFISLASATRFVGIFLVPVLFYEILKIQKKISLFNLILILLSSLGLIFYLIYLYQTTNDPLFFIHAQPAFGANRSGETIILLPQVIFRYFKIFFTSNITYDYLIALAEFSSLVFAGYLLIKNIKRLRISYQIFSWLTIITPTLTGSLSSMPRYILNAFPIFIALALMDKKFKIIYLIISSFLLVASTMYYFRGYFVA